MICEIDDLEYSDYNLSDSEDEFETLINRILDSSKSINTENLYSRRNTTIKKILEIILSKLSAHLLACIN